MTQCDAASFRGEEFAMRGTEWEGISLQDLHSHIKHLTTTITEGNYLFAAIIIIRIGFTPMTG